MAVFKHRFDSNFSVTPNTIPQNEGLKLKDIGLLVYMLSLPEEWSFSLRGLAAMLPYDKIDSISESVKRLEKAGYIRIRRTRTGGKFGGNEWDISDIPIFLDGNACSPNADFPNLEKPDTEKPDTDFPNLEKPDTEKPDTGFPDLEKPVQIKKTNIKENKNQSKQGEMGRSAPARPRFVPPTVDEVEEYVHERGSRVDPQGFIDFYAAKGWMIGKSKMVDWKAACRNAEKWERWDNPKTAQGSEGRVYTYEEGESL